MRCFLPIGRTPAETMKFTIAISGFALAATSFALTSNPAVADDGQCGSTCGSSAKAALAANVVAEKDIIDTAVSTGRFKVLADLLTRAELVEPLKGKGPFTVFAPSDAAFEKLFEANEGLKETLTDEENVALLTSVLTYHVVSGEVMAKDAVELSNATTLNGQRFDIVYDEEENVLTVDGSKVIMRDVKCTNGVIHVIEDVILPEQKNLVEVAAGAETFKTLLAAAKAAGLAKELSEGGPYTIFAPTDEAFAKLPDGTVEALLKPENKERLVSILKYHVVSGRVYADQAAELDEAPTLLEKPVSISITEDSATVGGANIVATDIEASNGVIHVVDAVLLPKN